MTFRHSPFESTLEVVATLRDGSIQHSIRAQREHDSFVAAVVSAYKAGVSINDLSDASGMPPDQILAAADKPGDSESDLAGQTS